MQEPPFDPFQSKIPNSKSASQSQVTELKAGVCGGALPFASSEGGHLGRRGVYSSLVLLGYEVHRSTGRL